ncbi:hypothetical protein Ahy_B06g085939 [Arachis hypogaea]|uniref:Replication factor A C-terminal domain-containing protein n=1 Tax=Arachis hypogaea TaxID=3818 RepID=A0A444YW45_ARAHY|nr:hypothetical protein Ahy_B06g085939 [Arachis hypogaea]
MTPRYRIKFSVIDDSDCACYVVFDKEAKQVLEESCVEILDPLLLKGDLSDTSTLLLNLIDKIFLFIVEVQISDISYFSPSYKVKKMTNNVDLINKFEEAHPIQIDVDYTDGLFPISKTSTIIEGEKNLLLEFFNEVAANDESEFDYPQSRKIRRWKEIPQLARRSRLRKKLENLDAHNLLFEFSNEVAANDESEFDYSRSRKIRRWKEIPQLARRSRLRKKLENLDAHVLESLLESI